MHFVVKLGRIGFGLALICTFTAGCAPGRYPTPDFRAQSVLITDRTTPHQRTHFLLVDRGLLIIEDRESGLNAPRLRIYRAIDRMETAEWAAVVECATLKGIPVSPGESVPAATAYLRGVYPNSDPNSLPEPIPVERFERADSLGPALETLRAAVASPGFEINSPPTWAFRNRQLAQELNLDN